MVRCAIVCQPAHRRIFSSISRKYVKSSVQNTKQQIKNRKFLRLRTAIQFSLKKEEQFSSKRLMLYLSYRKTPKKVNVPYNFESIKQDLVYSSFNLIIRFHDPQKKAKWSPSWSQWFLIFFNLPTVFDRTPEIRRNRFRVTRNKIMLLT